MLVNLTAAECMRLRATHPGVFCRLMEELSDPRVVKRRANTTRDTADSRGAEGMAWQIVEGHLGRVPGLGAREPVTLP